jgi:hypothetical protein
MAVIVTLCRSRKRDATKKQIFLVAHLRNCLQSNLRLRNVSHCQKRVFLGDRPQQGDQIGRIFASWAIVYFGTFLKITKTTVILGLLFSTVKVMHQFCNKIGLGQLKMTEVSQTLCYFFRGKRCFLILSINGLVYISFNFLTNPQGHLGP